MCVEGHLNSTVLFPKIQAMAQMGIPSSQLCLASYHLSYLPAHSRQPPISTQLSARAPAPHPFCFPTLANRDELPLILT